ncbi:MAG TPA: alpha/beta fold hydrolase [Burkholderiaceae bacterium]|jgi:predicted dienelactone hydrolase|nr:alpha/beta fold hydrolase [Burkholderiaceae bacterium]
MNDKTVTTARRWMKRIASALLLSCALPAAHAADTQPYNAGMRMGAIAYRQVSMPVALTYPTRAEAVARDFGPFRMTVAAGAPAAQAPEAGWPVVFVSHGTGGNLFNHADLVAALARAGYVVVVLEHPGDNFRDRSLVTDKRYFSERPAQLLALLQAFLDREGSAGAAAGGLLGDLRLDPKRVSLIGHSAGGYTAAVVAGATGDVRRVTDHCAAHADGDEMCGMADPNWSVSAAQAGPRYRLAPDAAMPASSADPRVRAAVLLAPLTVPLQPDSLGALPSALMVVTATHDEVLAPRFHGLPWAALASRSSIEIEPRAGHFSFMTSVPAERRAMLGQAGTDPAGFDRAQFQRELAARIIGFLDRSTAP